MADLEELKKQKICHLKLELPLEELKRLIEFWFNNPDSDYNLEKNFEALQQKHEQYFAKIDEFVQSRQSIPNTLEEIRRELERLNIPQNDLTQSLGDVFTTDYSFAYSLEVLFTGLQNNKAILEKIAKESDYPELKQNFDEMLKSIQSWIDKTSYAKAFILEAGRKRSLVFEIVKGKLELALEIKFAELAEQELENIRNQIDAILSARDLLVDIENWWFNVAALNGFGGGLKAKYLQFEKPLCIMRSDYAKGLSFHQQIDALESLPPMTKDTVKKQIQDHLDTLKQEIDELESGGWQECLEKQKRIIEARKRMGASLSKECKLAIENFESKSSEVKNIAGFRIAEEAYKQHIHACSL